MVLTKNKNLRLFKQKTENTYQMNQGIPKVKPFLERQMYDFKFLKVSFNGWNSFSNQMTLLCFLAGGAAAFGAYWYRTDPYYIVLYGSVGILAGLFTILVDHGAGIAEKKQQLFTALDNYLENTLIHRLDLEREEGQKISGPHVETRENIRSIYGTSQTAEPKMEEEPEKKTESLRGRQKTRAERQKRQLRAETQARRQEREDRSVREGADRSKTAEESSVYDARAREVSARNTLMSGESARDASGRGAGAREAGLRDAVVREILARDPGISASEMIASEIAASGAVSSGGLSANPPGNASVGNMAQGSAVSGISTSGNGSGVDNYGPDMENGGQTSVRGKASPSPYGSEECVDYLKRSLEQIAASRDRGRTVKQKEDWLKDLSPDELKLIGEILQEYLT